MNSASIRQQFLDFFRDKGHQIVPSAPMVVKNDPTLMFTNAGMNQFKDNFLGNKEPQATRIADTQKCLRVSGKHNDLEEVGHDTYHHTMFEMLGNWSFGDYFKEEAIAWAWELLTKVYGLDPERLYATVFEGDQKDGLPPDEEALNYWKKWLPEDHILYGSKKDNFWEMGDTGPCGPCSELHIDLRPEADRQKVAGRDLINKDNPLVVEIWNLVFIEFNRKSDGALVPLPQKHIDTGMGFERLCMALQGKQSNYDTDVFQPLLNAIASKAGIPYGNDQQADIAMRVVADHLRATAFAIADGQLPSNNKGGYVIRRILRRAVRYGYTFLGFREPVIYSLLPTLIEQMGNVFPELKSQQELLGNVIREEEQSFLKTLETGIQRFNQYIKSHSSDPSDTPAPQHTDTPEPKQPNNQISGAFAFELFDTYGFPVDLTRLMAKEIGWTVDMEGFREGLEEQKNRSRNAAASDAGDWVILGPASGMTLFTGYDHLSGETRITRYREIREKEKTYFQVVLESTPFYAESGGQVGDRGWLIKGDEKIPVFNTIRENELIIHLCEELFDDPTGILEAWVDQEARLQTTNNHTATHLLHAALRTVLGEHVEQKGSLVEPTRLRFDFTHFAKMTDEELRHTEQLVNQKIRENIPIEEHRDVPMNEAQEMGAIALFGEKYGDRVRVIRFDESFSTELCGGTHVPATGQIGLFRIVSESGIAAGIRRIEAVSGLGAESMIYEQTDQLHAISEKLKHPKNLIRGVEMLLEENQKLKKLATAYEKLQQQQAGESLRKEIREINGIHFLGKQVAMDMDAMKQLAFELRKEIPNLFFILASEQNEKAQIVITLSDDLAGKDQWHAGNMIRELAKEVGGGGGGQPHLATAGGKNPHNIPQMLKKAASMIP